MPLKMRPKWVEVVSTSRAIAIAYSNGSYRQRSGAVPGAWGSNAEYVDGT